MKLTLLVAGLALLPATAVAGKNLLTPAEAISRALAARTRALRACGVRWSGAGTPGLVRFKLDFKGKVRALHVDGAPPRAKSCVERQLASLRFPKRLAFIVKNISLPVKIGR